MTPAPALTTTTTRTTGTAVTTGQGTDPIVRVQVSFDTDITLPPVWTEITGFVRGIDYFRGRQFELDQFQTGTASITLDSNDGRFRPENTAGPYYGLLTPMRRVRIIAEYEGVVYPLWAGFVERWEPTANEYGKDLVTTLVASDQFKALRYRDLNGTWPAATTGNRILSVLTGPKGYDVTLTSAGTVVAQPQTFSAADPVDAAQRATAGEQGFLYCDEQGRVRFDDRNYRLLNEISSRLTFGDVDTEANYFDPVYNYNDERLYTEVRIKPGDNEAEQVVPASGTSAQISQYGRRTLAMTVPVQNSTVDATPNATWALTLANVLLGRYQNPGVRLDEISVNPYANTSYWPQLLSNPLGGRLTIRQRPAYLVSTGAGQLTSTTNTTSPTKITGTGGLLERPVYIERIQMAIRPGSGMWLIKYGLSDAVSLSYWVLGNTSFSILGSTTRPGV